MNIVQIGCNDGNDHVLKFVKDNTSNIKNIYLLDANSKCVDVCKVQYSGIEHTNFIHCAITTSDEPYVELFIPLDNDIAAQSSILSHHLPGHGCSSFRTEKVPSKKINQLFKDLKLETIDRLYIDVEGIDIDIINDIDFDKTNIKFLMFEYIHSDGTLSRGGEKLEVCKQRLEQLGYSLYEEEFNIIAHK